MEDINIKREQLRNAINAVRNGKKPMKAGIFIGIDDVAVFHGEEMSIDELKEKLNEYEVINDKPNIILVFDNDIPGTNSGQLADKAVGLRKVS